ncbi:uncharacterized protein LOC116987007 isoform X2 [Amblyraja radiata]|uniref:uncharacterized protein LOC116987007 isoform X2 n=1 Tax=Amblyraja radiata TaxID=386614 RepID=UPI001402230C|nr:uncharacterized protein LOC116987007 isoform X2 [Amblyraja radiata]
MLLLLVVLSLWPIVCPVSTQRPTCAYYLSRRQSGVFHYDRQNRYSLTFPAAKLACEQSFGAVMATRDQLHTACLSGLEECRAGWLLSGEVGYPRIHRSWNCGLYKVGIISYGVKKNLQEKWDVYCYKPDDDCSNYNKLLQLEDNILNSKSVNMSLIRTLASSRKNVSKKQEMPKPKQIRTQKDINVQFSNIAKPLYLSEHSTHLYSTETSTSVLSVKSSTAFHINSLEAESSKEPLHIENSDKCSNCKHSLETEEKGKVTAALDTSGTKNENQTEVIRNSSTSSAAELLHIWNVPVDGFTTSTINNDAGDEDIRPSQGSFNQQKHVGVAIPTAGLESAKTNSVTSQTVQPNMHLVTLKSTSQISPVIRFITESSNTLLRSGTNTFGTELPSSSVGAVTPGLSLEDVSNDKMGQHHQTVLKLIANYLNGLRRFPSSDSNATEWKSERADVINSTHSELNMEKPFIEKKKGKKLKFAFQGEVAQLDSVNTNGVTEVEEAQALSTDLQIFQSVTSIKYNTALPEITNAGNAFHLKTARIDNIRYPNETNPKNQGIDQLGFIRKDNKSLSETGHNYGAVMNHLQITEASLPQTAVTNIRLTTSGPDEVTFPVTFTSETYVQQDVTSDENSINIATSKNYLHMIRNDSDIHLLTNADPTPMQSVKTNPNISEPSFIISENSTVLLNSSEDSVEVETEGVPTPTEQSGSYFVTHFMVEGFASLDVTNVANVTDDSTESPLPATSFMSPASVQIPATDEPFLQLHQMSTLSFSAVTKEITPKGDTLLPFTSSFMSSDSCGGVMRQTEGRFQTPHYPQSYPSDMDCTWEIEAPRGYLVRLDFISLFIEEHRTCKYDYVVVYDGKGPSKVEMGRFCGSKVPPQLQGSSTVMSITMRSDSSMELEGFSARFSTFQIPTGYIRLVGGKTIYDGVIEIESDGQWGGICAKQWTHRDATVVCRQLGFTGPALSTRVDGSGLESQQAISYIKCRGSEVTVQDCDVKRNGTCAMGQRAAVICLVMESCAALKSAGVQESGTFTIDPDGLDTGVDPFPVECDMTSDSTTGITVIGHDSEGRKRVTPCEEAGCYSQIISYNQASLDQLEALTEISKSCEQYISLECRHIRFLGEHWGWWVSKDGRKINSWGGASTNSGKCACGNNGTCALGLSTCNCDANDIVWRQDEGHLRDKTVLPVQEVRFGDTQDLPIEMAFHRIGPLRCLGQSSLVPVLESCAALKEAGFQASGHYVIDPDGVGTGVQEFQVFCDMTSHPSSALTVVGHDSEGRIRVAPCEGPGCYSRKIKYAAELIQLNALTLISDSCEQYVKLDCRHIRFIQAGWGWWTSWDGKKMFNWGGATSNSGRCACGITESCSAPGLLCNCDSNDHVWRVDDGILRDKLSLPIQAVYFGDTEDAPLEMAFHTIGRLQCKGKEGTQKNHQSL